MTLVSIATKDAMATRSTEVRMAHQCTGALTLRAIGSVPATSAAMLLGTIVHEAIAEICADDLSLEEATLRMRAETVRVLEQEDPSTMLETKHRKASTMLEDGARLLALWFSQVHPSSNTRLPEYEAYAYPPKVEVEWHLSAEEAGTSYPWWGTTDALFEALDGGPPLLIDWKTGHGRPQDTMQLDHYRYGMGLHDSPAAFHHIESGKLLHAGPLSPGNPLQRVRATEATKASILVDGKYPTFNRGPACRQCVYQRDCPAFGTTVDREAKAARIRAGIREAITA